MTLGRVRAGSLTDKELKAYTELDPSTRNNLIAGAVAVIFAAGSFALMPQKEVDSSLTKEQLALREASLMLTENSRETYEEVTASLVWKLLGKAERESSAPKTETNPIGQTSSEVAAYSYVLAAQELDAVAQRASGGQIAIYSPDLMQTKGAPLIIELTPEEIRAIASLRMDAAGRILAGDTIKNPDDTARETKTNEAILAFTESAVIALDSRGNKFGADAIQTIFTQWSSGNLNLDFSDE